MTEITQAHAEWAVVDRLSRMLDEHHPTNGVTHSYALFTTILCWVLQRVRRPADHATRDLLEAMRRARIADAPWSVKVDARKERLGKRSFDVPGSPEFKDHTVERLLVTLRNAVAHGDARKITPFNFGKYLVGFTFDCQERSPLWRGKITLLETDMRRLGRLLARDFCQSLGELGNDATSIREIAA